MKSVFDYRCLLAGCEQRHLLLSLGVWNGSVATLCINVYFGYFIMVLGSACSLYLYFGRIVIYLDFSRIFLFICGKNVYFIQVYCTEANFLRHG